jgi:hypothetical protein
MKKEVFGIFGASWKKRYFMVSGHYLHYYDSAEASKDATDSKVKGIIDLATCKEIKCTADVVSATADTGEVQDMKAPNATDAAEWVEVMKAASCRIHRWCKIP